MNAAVEVFSRTGCGKCGAVRSWLTTLGHPRQRRPGHRRILAGTGPGSDAELRTATLRREPLSTQLLLENISAADSATDK